MDEKQIQIIIDDEIVDSLTFRFGYNLQMLLDYCRNNFINYIEHLEFEAFVAVFAEWR